MADPSITVSKGTTLIHPDSECQSSAARPGSAGRFRQVAGLSAGWLVAGLLLVGAGLPAPLRAQVEAAVPATIARVMDWQSLSADEIGLWVQAVDAAEPVLAVNPDIVRNPASVMKLYTTYAALQLLGPAHRWETRLFARPIPDQPGRAVLTLAAGGDPLLRLQDLWFLAGQAVGSGWTIQDGPLVLDLSYFEPETVDPGAFDDRPWRVYNQPSHPLIVNFNALRFHVGNGADGVRVRVDPPLPGLEIDESVRSGNGRCRGFQRGVAFAVDERRRVALTGAYPSGCADELVLVRRVLEPDSYARAAWALVWEQWGGSRVESTPLAQPLERATGETLVAVHHSPPLAEVLAAANKYSSNVISRQLAATLAAEAGGERSDHATGLAVIRQVLTDAGLTLDGWVFDHAAGLSREQRSSPRQIADLLRLALGQAYAPEYVASLPLFGLDGTLSRRPAELLAPGHGRLKTGSIDDVSALAGYVRSRAGTDYLVVVLVNAEEAHRGPGEALQHAVLEWVDGL